MIINKKWILFIVFSVIVLAVVFSVMEKRKKPADVTKEIRPVFSTIQSSITSTATVQPQNRLEIKPPINGRIDKILVKEGEHVKAGQILVLMSSTERAALLDAARGQGADTVKYWEDVYKPTPLISPIEGDVIVSTDEPGQTVTSSDVIMVLSDYLIVQAQVDETDIGRVKLGQEAIITLDAYPEIIVRGKVDHIYYESKTVNNVTIYYVDIMPETVPDVFRSGMTATVTIAEKTKENVLTIPSEVIVKGPEGAYVFVLDQVLGKTVERKIETGISDEKNTEIISGLTPEDKVLHTEKKYIPESGGKSKNPFMPAMRRTR